MIGRVDLIDVLTLGEYTDTLPDVLRERTTAAFQFVLRNPMTLDMPLRMAGQPGIYKMPKEVSIGARPLLKQVPYTWWPPEQYKNLVIGQFDLYPEERDTAKLQRILSSQDNVVRENMHVAGAPTVESLDTGCFVARNAYNLHY